MLGIYVGLCGRSLALDFVEGSNVHALHVVLELANLLLEIICADLNEQNVHN